MIYCECHCPVSAAFETFASFIQFIMGTYSSQIITLTCFDIYVKRMCPLAYQVEFFEDYV